MTTSPHVYIRPTRSTDAESLHTAINSVASEKWFLAAMSFSLDEVRAFLQQALERGTPHLVALRGDEVVGWCDITPGRAENGFSHVGRLGMGVVRECRR